MNEKQPKKGKKNSKELRHLDLDTANAASTTDFTGLIPANPQSEDQLDSYKEVYDDNNRIVEK